MKQNLARRTSRKPVFTSRAAWDDSRVNELLAWAEHSRRRGVGASAKYFESTVASHLQDIFRVCFSFAQIDEKLRELAQDADKPLSSIHRSNLYTGYGLTSVVHCVVRDRDALKILKARVVELDANPQSKPQSYGKPTNLLLSKEKQKGSPNLRLAQQSLKNARTLGDGYRQNISSSTKRQRRRKSAKFKKAKFRVEVPQTPTPERMALDVVTLTSSPSQEPMIATNNKVQGWDTSSITSSRDTCPLVFTPEQQLNNSLQKSSYSKTMGANQRDDESKSICDQSLGTDNIHLQFEEHVMSLKKDNDYLRQQLCHIQAENTTLQQEIKSRQCASRLLANCSWPTALATLERSEQEVEEWKRKATDRIALGTFIKNRGKQLTSYDYQDIQEYMQNLRCELEHFMQAYSDLSVHCHELPFDENEDLKILSKRILGDASTWSGTSTGSHILRALASAAICEWIFECELREDCLSNNLLTETMLTHLVTQDGENAAKSLHFAANDTVIRSSFFQNGVIPRRAALLADRLFQTLKTLIAHLSSNKVPTTYDQRQWNCEKQHLETAFTEALRVKASTLVSDHVFEVVLPTSGMLLDLKSMDVEKVTKSRESTGKRLIKFTLAPGLRSCEYDRPLVDYHSFRKAGSQSEFHFDELVKPLVLEHIGNSSAMLS